MQDRLLWMRYSRQLDPSNKKFFLYGMTLSLVIFYLIHILVFFNSRSRLNKYADDIFFQTEQLDFQIKRGLSRAKLVASEICSENDLDILRKILNQYYYLGDIGRVKNNQIICTVKKGLLKEPINLEDKPYKSSSDILYWNNQNDLFIDEKEAAIFTQGNTAAFLSTSFLAEVHIDIQTRNGSGGYLYLKDNEYILKVFDKIIVADHISQTLKKEASLYDRLLLPGSLIHTKHCEENSDICLMTIIKGGGVFQLSYFYIVLISLLSIILGMSVTYVLVVLQGGLTAFLKKFRKAIYAGKIYPVYQPKVNLCTHETIGVEVLARWNDPILGSVRPDIFIITAEQFQLIRPLTEQLIKQVFRDLNSILESNHNFSVSINVTASLIIDDDFISFLKDEVSQYKFNNKQLVLEITERTTSNREAMARASKIIKKDGYRISLDDFGTGFSNLSWLTTFEPNEIKIDKFFTNSIDTETINSITLDGIISMLNRLDVDVVFEGIEKENELNFIKLNMPNAIGQGRLFGMPQPIDELVAYLSN